MSGKGENPCEQETENDCIYNIKPKEEFTLEKAMAALSKLSEPKYAHLTFEEQCSVFALAFTGAPNRYIAHAFRVSGTTVSNITGCLAQSPEAYREEYSPDQNADLEPPRQIPYDHNRRRDPARAKRYNHVAKEFQHLGERPFLERYLTVEVYRKIRVSEIELKRLKAEKKSG